MAGRRGPLIVAILRAVWTALRRSQSSIASVKGNIFFPVTFILMQEAGAFLYLLAAMVLFFGEGLGVRLFYSILILYLSKRPTIPCAENLAFFIGLNSGSIL